MRLNNQTFHGICHVVINQLFISHKNEIKQRETYSANGRYNRSEAAVASETQINQLLVRNKGALTSSLDTIL